MISAGDFRKNVTFEMDGKVYNIIEFMHVKPGKGAAFVRTKIKNVVTGQVIDHTFNPSEKYEEAKIERREMQYLYNEGGLYYFMDLNTYDQVPFNYETVKDVLNFIPENGTATVSFYKNEPFAVEPPLFVELQIVECEPAIQGDTVKSGGKPAKLETGYTISVPMFVMNGDRVRVDTRTGSYMERV